MKRNIKIGKKNKHIFLDIGLNEFKWEKEKNNNKLTNKKW